MTVFWGSQFRNRGPIHDPSSRAYDWVVVDHPDEEWQSKVRQVYDYWDRLRPLSANGARLLPSRKDWDVLDVAQFMPNVRFFDIVPWSRSPGWRYRCRLVGTNQAEALGFDPTGQWLDEAEPWTWADKRFLSRQEAMMSQNLPTWRRGEIVFERTRDKGVLECLQMPFANDGVTVDMIADFTLYMFPID